jgi:hypothetical protein
MLLILFFNVWIIVIEVWEGSIKMYYAIRAKCRRWQASRNGVPLMNIEEAPDAEAEVDVKATNWHLTIPEIKNLDENSSLGESVLFPLMPVQLRPKKVDEETAKPHLLHE